MNNINTQNIKTCPNIEEIDIEKEKLDTNLVKGVLELVQTKEHLKYPDIQLKESFISIIFNVDIKNSGIYFSDTTVNITYNIIEDNNAPIVEYYRGMLNVEGYNVAIFDIGRFGYKYYNTDSLNQIPLNVFKPYPMNVVLTIVYYVHNGDLYYWNP
jgi:hypothetical protein